jgi:hypothetical protein
MIFHVGTGFVNVWLRHRLANFFDCQQVPSENTARTSEPIVVEHQAFDPFGN